MYVAPDDNACIRGVSPQCKLFFCYFGYRCNDCVYIAFFLSSTRPGNLVKTNNLFNTRIVPEGGRAIWCACLKIVGAREEYLHPGNRENVAGLSRVVILERVRVLQYIQ